MSGAIKQARANFQGDAGYGRAMPGTGFAGDPGLFGSIFGGIKKGFGIASGLVPGGGAIRQAISLGTSALSRFRGGTRVRVPPRQIGTRRGRAAAQIPMQAFQGPGQVVEPAPGVRAAIERFLPGGKTGLQVPGVAIGARIPQGYHLNKSSYWTGAGGMNPVYIPKESIFVKNRKRNPLNPRAWDRAFGRLNSAQNFKKKMGRITIREKC